MKNDIWKGSTSECVRLFAERCHLNVKKNRTFPLRNEVSDFLGIDEQTGYQRFKCLVMPHGVNLLKLQLLLELAGYEIEERIALPHLAHSIGVQIALNPDLLKKAAGQMEVKQDAILAWTFGRSFPTDSARLDKLGAFVEDRTSSTQEKLDVWLDFLKEKKLIRVSKVESLRDVPEENQMPPTEQIAKSDIASDAMKDRCVASLANLVLAALPLARFLDSEACAEEDRMKLRELAGNAGVFKLSNMLNRLCSSRARSAIESSKQ